MRIILYILAIFLIVTSVGFILPNPRITKQTTEITASNDIVWSIISQPSKQLKWRKDLQCIDVNKQSNEWTETLKNGVSITFRERKKIAPTLYEIEIVPTHGFGGYSIVELETIGSNTLLTLTEASEISNPFRRIFSFLFYKPSKHMQSYFTDLKNAVDSKLF